MRIARKLTLLALMAIAAMALAATTASAQTVEVIDEDTLIHCPPLTAAGGGCRIHTEHNSSELQLRGHLFGIESTASDCLVGLEGEINEDGEGRIERVNLEDHPGVNDCVRVPCLLPWHVDVTEVPGSELVEAEFCVEDASGGNRSECHVVTSFNDAAGDHQYEAVYNDIGTSHDSSIDCELLGELHLETTTGIGADPHQDIEILHPIEQ